MPSRLTRQRPPAQSARSRHGGVHENTLDKCGFCDSDDITGRRIQGRCVDPEMCLECVAK